MEKLTEKKKGKGKDTVRNAEGEKLIAEDGSNRPGKAKTTSRTFAIINQSIPPSGQLCSRDNITDVLTPTI